MSHRPVLRTTALLLLAASCGPGDPCWVDNGAVTVAVSAITLGNDCGGTSSSAPSAAPRSGACSLAEDGGNSSCGGYCTQTSLQLSIASTRNRLAKLEVRAVRLYNSKTGILFATLSASDAKQWVGSQYVAWDEQIPAQSSVKGSWKLTTPAWFGPNGYSSLGDTSTYFRTEVDVAIDGVVHTLAGPDAYREPEVNT